MRDDIRHMKKYIQPLRELKDCVEWMYDEHSKEWVEGMAKVIQKDQMEQYNHFMRKINEINYKQ